MGRPPRTDWITPGQLSRLPIGTAVLIDAGDHKALVRSRIAGCVGTDLHLTNERVLDLTKVVRARVVNGLYDPGDLVVRRDAPESAWRGGVMSVRGYEVQVETLDGITWVHEDELRRRDFAPSHVRARNAHSPSLSE